MAKQRFDSYCGLYCGACEVMNAVTYQDKERVISIFRDLWEKTGMGGVTPDEVECTGCKTDNVFINCSKCFMRQCAISKGVEFCIDCLEFPCSFYKQGEEVTAQFPQLKHLRPIVKNQEFIKEHGLDEWLKDQEIRWECPSCKTRYSWYAQECRNCKEDLKGIKDYENLKD
ncbi:MAG: DUF3795 domain-containing protein [archaeon]